MSEQEPIEQALALAWPPGRWGDVSVLLAVSGGADSMALLRAALAVQEDGPGSLIVAHFNHRLRGSESDADQAFVERACRQLDVTCRCGSAADPGASDSSEAAARDARYGFLQRTAEDVGARYVATAHTADDQAETVLHRIVRGTGLRGLAGMRPFRPLGEAVTLVRPLLEVRRSEIIAYLQALAQPFCHDASNLDPRYTRNRIRHELLPSLADDFNPAVVDALLRLARQAAEANEVIAPLVEGLWSKAVLVQSPTSVRLDCQALGQPPPYLVRALLLEVWRRQDWPQQAMGRAQWNELAALLLAAAPTGTSEGSTRELPGNITAGRRQGYLWLSRSESTIH